MFKIDRMMLSNSVDKFDQLIGLPSVDHVIPEIDKATLIAAEYISIISYPELEQIKDRKDFYDAILQAILREKKLNYLINLHFENPKKWPRIDSCLNKGKKRFVRALFFWQAYTHFIGNEKSNKEITYSWNNYLVRSLAFYQNYDDGYAFDNFSNNFNEIYKEKLNSPSFAQEDLKYLLRPLRKDWQKYKKSLHLCYGIIKVFEEMGVYTIPVINELTGNPSWVSQAVKRSQYKLAKYLNSEIEQRKKTKIELSPTKMPFIDLVDDPIFIQKGEIV
ncbi:hypothetical protein [Pseudoalteromonas gelatinilytica]|uniref:hypothetical protein n=1 Tax=Pseudoalteromonas gelatinilytica TaxID=1703256 RepID=UPI0007C4EC66|nr:hypothetical protein [Pseudoalteromonas gelatinilytica]